MIKAPHTYSEWAEVIGIFKNKEDDEDALKAMKAGTVEWQSGVAERFSKRLIDAVNYRMNAASDKFQKELSRSRGEDRAIIQAILGLRKEMAFLAQAIDLPAIPQELRSQYIKMVYDQADTMQKSLEDSAKSDRSGKMSSIIRNHKVNSF